MDLNMKTIPFRSYLLNWYPRAVGAEGQGEITHLSAPLSQGLGSEIFAISN